MRGTSSCYEWDGVCLWWNCVWSILCKTTVPLGPSCCTVGRGSQEGRRTLPRHCLHTGARRSVDVGRQHLLTWKGELSLIETKWLLRMRSKNSPTATRTQIEL